MLIKILGGDPRSQNVSAMVYKDGISNVMDKAFALHLCIAGNAMGWPSLLRTMSRGSFSIKTRNYSRDLIYKQS